MEHGPGEPQKPWLRATIALGDSWLAQGEALAAVEKEIVLYKRYVERKLNPRLLQRCEDAEEALAAAQQALEEIEKIAGRRTMWYEPNPEQERH